MYVIKGRNGKVYSVHKTFQAAKADQLRRAVIYRRLDLRIARGTK